MSKWKAPAKLRAFDSGNHLVGFPHWWFRMRALCNYSMLMLIRIGQPLT